MTGKAIKDLALLPENSDTFELFTEVPPETP
jgi:hypothetical protein